MKAYFDSIAHTASIFGWWHRETLRAVFPPFYGWGIGCGYCELEAEAKQRRWCKRGKAHGFTGCGWDGRIMDGQQAAQAGKDQQ